MYERTYIHTYNQYRAIRHEFEPVGHTLLKNPLGAKWGFTAYLAVGGLLASYLPNRQVERRFHSGN